MSDALPLPARPNLEQYKKLAKDLQRACKSSDPDAIRRWAGRWTDAEAERIERRWRKFRSTHPRAAQCALTDAQSFLAREHGFTSWPKFAGHLKSLQATDSVVSKFEAAADAIVSGDRATLEKLLRANPELLQARSTREHRSTLLHYVSANGIEDFRQKTPKNIIEITKLLLSAGADVNAESDAYGGRSTTLELAATSCHPEAAGVQLALLQLLIDHGATIDCPDGSSTVNSCLHNGRGEAAEFLASRGARLDLEGACGVGRLDLVRQFADNATEQETKDGFAWACEFGRTEVVEFLLQQGGPLDATLRHHGGTGLHWAAWGGHADIVKLLLQRGARVDVRDQTFDGTPLGWALYAWRSATPRQGHYEVIALLVRAGAQLDPQWYEENDERRRAAQKMRSDARMMAALRGEFSST